MKKTIYENQYITLTETAGKMLSAKATKEGKTLIKEYGDDTSFKVIWQHLLSDIPELSLCENHDIKANPNSLSTFIGTNQKTINSKIGYDNVYYNLDYYQVDELKVLMKGKTYEFDWFAYQNPNKDKIDFTFDIIEDGLNELKFNLTDSEKIKLLNHLLLPNDAELTYTDYQRFEEIIKSFY